MKRIITILLLVVTIFPFSACNTKLNIEDTNVVNELEKKIELIKTEYYEKYEGKNFVLDDVKEKLYVKVATGLKTAYQVGFGSVQFANKQKVKFNIGKNSNIYTLAFYKDKEDLYVFAPLLALEGSLNKTLLFCVDGQYFSSKIYNGEYNQLKINEVKQIDENKASTISTQKNNADRDVITHSLTDYTSKLSVEFSRDNIDLPDSAVFFVRKSYQKYSEPTEYSIFIPKSENKALLITHATSQEMLVKEQSRYIDVAVGVTGGGLLGFDLVLDLT